MLDFIVATACFAIAGALSMWLFGLSPDDAVASWLFMTTGWVTHRLAW